jgi:hypothetical protein
MSQAPCRKRLGFFQSPSDFSNSSSFLWIFQSLQVPFKFFRNFWDSSSFSQIFPVSSDLSDSFNFLQFFRILQVPLLIFPVLLRFFRFF